MGAIEDTRKVLQDFLAPELRAITVRLDALEKQVGGLDHRMDDLQTKFDALDRRAEQRHDAVMMALGRLVDYGEVRERLARLEARQHSAN